MSPCEKRVFFSVYVPEQFDVYRDRNEEMKSCLPASLRLLTISSLCVCLTMLASTGGATSQPTQSPPIYQGAYWALQVHGGYTTGPDTQQGDSGGPSVGVSVRLASIVSLADVQLTVLGSSLNVSDQGSDVDVLRLSIGAEAHLHPFFLLTLNDSYWETWLAGIYLSIGGDLDLTQIGDASLEPDAGWHVGLGTDIPLTSLNDGTSFWMGLGVRFKFLDVESSGSDIDFDETTLVLTFGYRNHDINFTRWPRPPEFYDDTKGSRE